MFRSQAFTVLWLTVLSLVLLSSRAFHVANQQLFALSRQNRMIRVFQSTSSATVDETDKRSNSDTPLDPKTVASRIFADDQRPVILFDGGT
jgi:hypothetical protein